MPVLMYKDHDAAFVEAKRTIDLPKHERIKQVSSNLRIDLGSQLYSKRVYECDGVMILTESGRLFVLPKPD